MKKPLNYLLGFGERYTAPITHNTGGGVKKHPYDYDTAKQRLGMQLSETLSAIERLPNLACPNNKAVIGVTIHPAYIARSWYPSDFFQLAAVEPIGSREVMIKPDAWGVKTHPNEAPTAEFFVSAKREQLMQLKDVIDSMEESAGMSIRKIERIGVPKGLVRDMVSDSEEPLLEVVLHSYADDGVVLGGFSEYMNSLEIQVDLEKRIHSGGLCFLPVRAPRSALSKIEKFSFLRVAREMPSLRVFRPSRVRSTTKVHSRIKIPEADAVDPSIRVAVFDGGMPSEPDLSKYVRHFELPDLQDGVTEFEQHGLGVTSALLFGPLQSTKQMLTPFATVDHYRVLDSETQNDSQDELFSVLARISAVLESQRYDFINLSIGPDLPIEDDDVHVWTAVLDPLLADGRTLATIAVGNEGESDWLYGNARIQSPSDCVNAVAVGSSNTQGNTWQRADYSCIGPGRSPGILKPDILDFGGCPDEPFNILHPARELTLYPEWGTSFAAPNALHKAIGLRACLGSDVSSLAIRALLLHRCEKSGHDEREVGRGRVLASLSDLLTCEDDTIHVIYQGEFEPTKWLRANIPVPQEELSGYVEIKVTICFASEVDPQDSICYTRGGLEYAFRPHSGKIQPGSKQGLAKTKTFRPKNKSERELRDDWHKWETAWSHSERVLGSNLKDPVIDFHYLTREGGGPAVRSEKVPYALVISVRKKGMTDLYNKVVQRYRLLRQLRPVIQIPIRT